jgi:hypothetical protein
MRKLSYQDLTAKAQLIVVGRAVASKSIWANRDLNTLVTISVDEVLKGDQLDIVTVVLPGGVDANRKFPLAMMVPGAPQIHSQEEVFLFLTRARQDISGGIDSYTITGFSQGKFSVVTDASGHKLLTQHQARPSTSGLVSLTQLKHEISALLSASGAAQQP